MFEWPVISICHRSDKLGCSILCRSLPVTNPEFPLFKAVLAIAALLVPAIPGHARITRLAVERTETLPQDGYKKVAGHSYEERDPKRPLNAIITDGICAAEHQRHGGICGDVYYPQADRHG